MPFALFSWISILGRGFESGWELLIHLSSKLRLNERSNIKFAISSSSWMKTANTRLEMNASKETGSCGKVGFVFVVPFLALLVL